MTAVATPNAAPDPSTAPVPAGRPWMADLAAFGLLLTVLVAIVHFVASSLTGTSLEMSGMFLVVALVPLLTAVAIRRGGTGANVLGLVVTIVLVLAGFWLAFGLAFIASPIEFTTALAFVLAIVFSLVGNTMAIVHRRRRTSMDRGSSPLRRLVIGTGTTLGIAAIVSSGVAFAGGASVDAAAASGAHEVTMRGMAFEESEIAVAAGGPARLLVHNADPFVHDIVIRELDVEEVLSPGDEVLIEVTAPAGDYTVYCTLHADTSISDPETAGMATRLVAAR